MIAEPPAEPPPGLPPGLALERGTAVAVGDRAVLIVGPSGAGKSSLALDLISRGAILVADDAVLVEPAPDGPRLSAPAATRGLIEARGLGLLRVPHAPAARLRAVVDLGQEESERLPPERRVAFHGASLPLLHGVRSPSFAAALHLYLQDDAD